MRARACWIFLACACVRVPIKKNSRVRVRARARFLKFSRARACACVYFKILACGARARVFWNYGSNEIQKCNASSINKIKENNYSIISKITSIITVPSSSSIFCLNDKNLTKSVNVSNLKQNATRYFNQDLKNVTQNVIDQKNSNLCVPISVATLLRFAMKNDLAFENERFYEMSWRLSVAGDVVVMLWCCWGWTWKLAVARLVEAT